MRDQRAPELRADFWVWQFSGRQTQIIFMGKGPSRDRLVAFDQVADQPGLHLSWPQQVHSATVLTATNEGLCGEADALVTTNPETALSVATADCVPIVIEGQRSLATIHAGWRGLAGRIIRETLGEMDENVKDLRAWIGPAIGVCCYEVGLEVADQVVAASHPTVLRRREPRPHLDLQLAAQLQLSEGGVRKIHVVSHCTRCSGEWLWSYRRDGDRAGRNWAIAWRQ